MGRDQSQTEEYPPAPVERPHAEGRRPTGRATPEKSGKKRKKAQASTGKGQLPRVLGDFELKTKLGQGGCGAVFRARQISLNRDVALKILPPDKAANADDRQAFLREGQNMARLRHHGIVTCHQGGVIDGYHFLAMELAEKGDCERQLRKVGTFSCAQVLAIVEDIAEGLHQIAAAGMVHGDIKPANILLHSDGSAVIADLGTVSPAGQPRAGNRIVGTFAYMAPEQADSGVLDVRSDLYALGSSIYRLLSGKTPYPKADPAETLERIRSAPPPDIRTLVPDLHRGMVALVRKLMARKPEDRFRSARHVVRAVHKVREWLDPDSSVSLNAVTPAQPIQALPHNKWRIKPENDEEQRSVRLDLGF